jgi:hypothetical protein
MDKNCSFPLHTIPWIALGMFCLFHLAGCRQPANTMAGIPMATSTELPAHSTEGVKPTPVSGNESQETQIESYIVQEIAGEETEHRYIVRVSANNLRAPLPMTKEVIQKCWLYQDGTLQECLADDFVNSVSQEGTGAWKYSYVIFSIVDMDAEAGRATVRMDELAGPQARKGLLYTLVQVEGKWQTESSKLLWSG